MWRAGLHSRGISFRAGMFARKKSWIDTTDYAGRVSKPLRVSVSYPDDANLLVFYKHCVSVSVRRI